MTDSCLPPFDSFQHVSNLKFEMNNIDGNNNNLTLVYTEKKGREKKKKDLMTNEIDRLR